MARQKKLTPKQLKDLEKQRLILQARKTLVRYFAFTNAYNYQNAKFICEKHGLRMMDIAETSKYYIQKGWMTGEPIKTYVSSCSKGCALTSLYQAAVIANCPIGSMTMILEDSAEEQKDRGYGRYGRDAVSTGFCLLTKALNIYCRSHPETLAILPAIEFETMPMPKMDDGTPDMFPETVVEQNVASTSLPNEDEQQTAMELWKEMSAGFKTSDFAGILLDFIVPLACKPEFEEFFQLLPENVIRPIILHKVYRYERYAFIPKEEVEAYLHITEKAWKAESQPAFDEVYDHLLFYCSFLHHGNIDGHLAKMHPHTKPFAQLSAIKLMNEGNAGEAVKVLETHMKSKGAYLYSDSYANFIYLSALLKTDTAAALKKATSLAKKKDVKTNAYAFIRLMLEMKAHPETDFKEWVKYNFATTSDSILANALFVMLIVANGYSSNYDVIGEDFAQVIKKHELRVPALDCAQVFNCLKDDLPRLEEETGMHALLDKVVKKEEWENVLDTMLMKYGSEPATASGKKTAAQQEISRIIYHVNPYSYSVQPRLQKSKNGGATWSSGRNIAMGTFEKGMPEMTPQDVMVSKLVETYSYGWYGQTTKSLSGANVIAALVGCPLVFDEHNPDLKIEIQEEKLQVVVKETQKGYKVTYNVEEKDGKYNRISVKQENAQLLKVVRLTPQDIEMLHLFDRVGTFPLAAKPQLTKLLAALGKKVTIMSPLLKGTDSIKSKKGSTLLTVQIVPYGEAFTMRCFVKPLVDKAPYCTPGKGLEYIAATVKGEVVQVERDLKAERKNYKALQAWMEPFDEYLADDTWQVPAMECLTVLDMLREHQDTCRIEWPEGVRFKISRPMLNASSLKLSLKGVGHWFEVDGNVAIDDKESMKISELLRKVREAKGNFIQLGDTEYMAISKDLQKQLTALDRMLQTDRKKLKLSQFNSSFVRDMELSGVTLDADKNYKRLQERLEEADHLKIRVPKMLQAELRDYQLDGYRWLSRLAHWGAGACLADDMGLGKTVQTIALLLSRAAEGPSLVVMPTSVLINWQNELQRFAPTLNPIVLRQASDRKQAVDGAGKNDVVLATYGLLPTEEELLASKHWNVIVLDEAHTIKNKETKTSKVAMQLEADFRLLLTGTPLQNHLSEIWNLFQFATPGLLTDYKQFTEEFINPIERDQEKEPQRLLKRMLSPFILRRTKNEVLNELPEKTEITLKVELSPAERALYDRFRQEAILNLEDGGRSSAIKALAEITKLRQTACNAALVLPAKEAKGIPSAKCEAFLKLVDELMANHHRALVFSQFTSHLAIIEKELQRRGINYQYLDGAVSPTERIRRVEDFQKGEQPLFLISLKAGGTGLNLTSADYVIHLDPWWNPSIEDQASDRAYRIGQDKPVTVYRLIATDTIEEKIIALHQTKKSLADSLLEGSDMAHKLTKDEILELIRL